MILKSLFIALSLLLANSSWATPGEHPPVSMPTEFDKLKPLVGVWEGTSQMEGKDEKVKVVYELSSNNTILSEKLMAGTPMEMTSIYHKKGKSLAMTHYCSMGNQPEMQLKKTDDKTMAFEMTKATGVTSMKEPHMHAVTLTWLDPNTITQEWTHFENGKKKGTVVINLKRKK